MGNTAHSHLWEGPSSRGRRRTRQLHRGIRATTADKVDALIKETDDRVRRNRTEIVAHTQAMEPMRRNEMTELIARKALRMKGWFTLDELYGQDASFNRRTVHSVLGLMVKATALRVDTSARESKYHVDSAWVRLHLAADGGAEGSVVRFVQKRNKELAQSYDKLVAEYREVASTPYGRILLLAHSTVRKGISIENIVKKVRVSPDVAGQIAGAMVARNFLVRTPSDRFQRRHTKLQEAIDTFRTTTFDEPASPPAPTPVPHTAVSLREENSRLQTEVIREENAQMAEEIALWEENTRLKARLAELRK
jgi:hypothetical protein